MNRKTLLTLVCVGSLMAGACSKGGKESVAGTGELGMHKAPAKAAEIPAPGTEMVAVIKGQKLAEYAGPTIGEAFGAYRYFEKTQWRQSKASGGKIYVDFVGSLKPGAEVLSSNGSSKVQGVEVKFVIYADGSFNVAMVSTIEPAADGALAARPVAEIKRVVDAIYANQEMKL